MAVAETSGRPQAGVACGGDRSRRCRRGVWLEAQPAVGDCTRACAGRLQAIVATGGRWQKLDSMET